MPTPRFQTGCHCFFWSTGLVDSRLTAKSRRQKPPCEGDAATEARQSTKPSEYQAIYDKCHAFVHAEKDNQSGNWELMNGSTDFEQDSLRLESSKYKPCMDANPDIICVRGRLRFPGVLPRQVVELILNLENRTQWDSQMESGEKRVSYDVSSREGHREGMLTMDVAALKYKGQRPFVSARDLCLLRVTEDLSENKDESHLALYAQSIPHDAVPVDGSGSYVRAELHQCGYLAQLCEDSSGKFYPSFYTDVTYISSSDFKGSIPSTFTNVILRQQPATLLDMRKLLSAGKEWIGSDYYANAGLTPDGSDKQCAIM